MMSHLRKRKMSMIGERFMKVEEALDIVYEYTVGDNSVLYSIRVGLGLNEKNYHSLIEANYGGYR